MTKEMQEILEKHLIRDEGLRLKPYRCTAGKKTIGVGRNLDGKGLSEEEKKYLGIPPRNIDDGITEEEAMYLLRNDIKEIEEQAKTFPWYEGLNDARKLVILNMIFNMGITTLRTFRNSLGYVAKAEVSGKQEDWELAASNFEKSKWYKQVGARAKRLMVILREGKL